MEDMLLAVRRRKCLVRLIVSRKIRIVLVTTDLACSTEKVSSIGGANTHDTTELFLKILLNTPCGLCKSDVFDFAVRSHCCNVAMMFFFSLRPNKPPSNIILVKFCVHTGSHVLPMNIPGNNMIPMQTCYFRLPEDGINKVVLASFGKDLSHQSSSSELD